MSVEKRIVDLETRAAYQDKLIEDLDGVLRDFSSRVEALETMMKDVKESLDAPADGPADDRPPHY